MSKILNFFKLSKASGAAEAASEAGMEAMAANKAAILNSNTRSDFVNFLNPENIQTVSPHQPLIKFNRKLTNTLHSAGDQIQVLAASGQQAAAVAASAPTPGGALEWYQIPARYRRAPIDDQEMDVINFGGADKIFQ